MPDAKLLWIPVAALLAYAFKASTGFGSAIVLVALASHIVGPVRAVILVGLLDVVGGLQLLRIDKTEDARRMWLPLVVAMAAGAVAGGLLLWAIPSTAFGALLGWCVVAVGLWMLVAGGPADEQAGTRELLERAQASDVAVCAFAGVCGGLTSLSGPPVIVHFGRKQAKAAFRRTLTRIFLAEAIARTSAYVATGMIELSVVWLALASIPAALVGTLIGDRVFHAIPHRWFARVVGAAVVLSGLRLVL
jgi:uncharacterized membrane protein YfcA